MTIAQMIAILGGLLLFSSLVTIFWMGIFSDADDN
jgi:hypothetical protein